ncbi:hypothetical protein B4135_2292 [Caldibacillus debilis]|uniref:Toprim domain-containing protein n=1 Tax=Caldibacillus debilis TaxID=301148 RepID=A0A150M249_9BACI|nr:hypothetical protein B4135_2292 [Caldibacillus debilis]
MISMTDSEWKVIVVEGKTDKRKVLAVVDEPVEVICTNGTIGIGKIDEWTDRLPGRELFILTDADESGEKLRKKLRREFPEAKHLYIDRSYREVAAAPDRHVAQVLLRANIAVKREFL